MVVLFVPFVVGVLAIPPPGIRLETILGAGCVRTNRTIPMSREVTCEKLQHATFLKFPTSSATISYPERLHIKDAELEFGTNVQVQRGTSAQDDTILLYLF